MERALVIGASGNFGQAVARQMVERGWEVRALRRSAGRAVTLKGIREVEGDAFDAEAVQRAARGVDVIVHAYNAPYTRWHDQLLPPARHVARAAIENGATIVLPGNVYGLGSDFSRPLGSDFSRPLAEGASRDAPTAKGRLRNQLEAELEAATERGARLLNVRCGDYLGPGADNTWFRHMTQKALKGGALVDPGTDGVLHEWAYLPDVANATVDLLARRAELGPSETFHFSSYQLTSRQLLEVVNRALPAPRPIRRMPWRLMRWLSPFAPMLRELCEMRYLWEQPVLLDDRKLRTFLGAVPRTPIDEAVSTSLGRAPLPAVIPADRRPSGGAVGRASASK